MLGQPLIILHRRLISQIAEELWEVKDKQIVNLTKAGIDIKQYKNMLMKASAASIEKAKLVSKNSQKGAAVRPIFSASLDRS